MKFTAKYERDLASGAWLVHAKEEPRCHTYGKSLAKARENVLEALGLFFEDVKPEDVIDEVEHRGEVREAIAAAAEARRVAEDAELRYAILTRYAVRVMNGEDYSYRDIGDALDISHQRAQQMSHLVLVSDIADATGRPENELRALIRDEFAAIFPSHVPVGDWPRVDDRMARWLYKRFGVDIPEDDTDKRANNVRRARAAKKAHDDGRT
jgi:predicted RNase H-like HicB family nuclease